MGARPSRAYKLKLSPSGIALFLDCHGRLCHLVGDLLPYGTTLRVSVTMLEAMPLEDLVLEIASEKLSGFAGAEIRFVGTSPTLAAVTAGLADRVVAGGGAAAPRTWRLFLTALSSMRSAGDAQILSAYDGLRVNDQTMRPLRGRRERPNFDQQSQK